MKATASEAEERSARAAVVHWLKAYGLRAKDKTWTVFGSPLSLHRIDEDHAAVPNFVVEACQYLQQHASTEGLFRKSGSFSRMKELKERIQCGEASVCAAPACDVAGLLKQFFRELPEPLIARELHDVFYRAQQLEEVARLHATLLLTCLLPPSNVQVLRYLMAFLKHIAHRSDENRMDVANLAVVFAPNLMHSGSGSKAEKVSSSTEKQLRLQAMVVQTLILHAKDIGHVSRLVAADGPCLGGDRGGESGGTSETPLNSGGDEQRSVKRSCRRRSFNGQTRLLRGPPFLKRYVVSGAIGRLRSGRGGLMTPQPEDITTPQMPRSSKPKRKASQDSLDDLDSSGKKRRAMNPISLEEGLSQQYSATSTPVVWSNMHSGRVDDTPGWQGERSTTPSERANGGEGTPSTPSLLKRSRLRLTLSTGRRRKQPRLSDKKAPSSSVEVEKQDLPPPARNEKIRKSLRMRLNLLKSSSDHSAGSDEGPAAERDAPVRSEALAARRDCTDGQPNIPVGDMTTPRTRSSLRKHAGPRSLCSSEEVLGRPNIREVISGPMQGSVSDADLADVKQAQIDTTTPLCAARSAPALVTGKPPCFPDARRSGRLPSTGRDSPEMPELPDRTGDQANSQAFRAFCESAKILSMLIQDTPQVLSTSTFTPRCRDAGISSSVTVSCGNENTTAVHSPDCISSQTVFQAGELMTERAMESSSDVCGTLADGKSECVKVKEEGEGGEKCNGESEDNVHIAMSNMSYAEYKQVELRRAINESVDILGAKEDKEPQQPLRECGVHEDLGAAHSEQLSECHLHISESSTGVSTEAEISLAGGQDAASIECLEKSPLSELGSKLEGISLCYTGKKCRQAKRLLQSGTSVVVSLQSGQESGVITSVANVSSVADRIRKFNDLKGKEQFSRPRVTAAPLAVVPTAKRQHVKQIISILETNSRGESAKRDPVKVGLPAVQKPKTQNIVSPLGESLFKTTRHQLERSSTQAATKTARAHGATEKSQGSETFIPKSGAAHWLRSASKQGQLKTQSTNGSPCTPVGLALVNLTNQPSSTKSSGKRGRCRPHTEPAADTPKASPTLRPGRRGSVTRRASQREKRPSRGTPRRPVVPQRLLATHMAWDL
ncbi:uncharacterized protein LOC144933535 isoform X2 [Lampetra fluviatilis]